jgi:predicted protein tyrosine phosphatase
MAEQVAASLPRVIIASRTQAERLLISRNPRAPIHHIISIGAPGDPAPAGFELCANGIRLEFHDDTGDIGPQRWHVEQVIDFGGQIQGEGGRLLVHCEAGISRSSAAALTVFATWLGAGNEQEAVDRTYAAQPHAWPNSQLVEHADALLERNGALIAVVDKAIEALDAQELWRRYIQRMERSG